MKFSKVFLAALLAVVVGSVVSGLFWLFTFLGIAGSMGSSNAVAVLPNSILKIDLTDNIVDSPAINPFSSMDFTSMSTTRTLPLLKVLRAIESAAADERIKGIYININYSGAGSITSAGLEELREALVQFKSSGKFIVAFNDAYSQTAYYLCTVADKIYLQPEGSFSWRGMSSTLLFYKGALDKLGIHTEVFRPTACKYKSAVEPYILNKMSDANRKQMEELGESMWNTICTTVAEARGITVAELNKIADTTPTLFPEQALERKLIDGIIYRDQMEDVFAEYGVERNFMDEYEYISLGDYCANIGTNTDNLSAPKIGIIYAEGSIVDGENKAIDGNIYGTTLANTIAKARKDQNIKAVVLRVNSPGGSALASDIIWREVELLKKEKPVIVSMGAYAASGGYYISAPADAIVANKLTLTGSIGVFGLMLEGGDMLRNKLGITSDVAKTNPSADFGVGVLGMNLRKSTAAERALLISSVDRVYEAFTTKVAAGRNLELQKVLNIAEGRVWSGTEAVNNGLADANGGLKTAIAIAADKAGIADNFRVEEILNELDPFTAMLQSLGMQMKTLTMDNELQTICSDYQTLRNDLLRSGTQAYCPYRVSF
ncbi:MAG: signal peptide peptidase SppA [Alistipes sp.]|nr:signal peptide peptidase SppA [Alistipes sp.]